MAKKTAVLSREKREEMRTQIEVLRIRYHFFTVAVLTAGGSFCFWIFCRHVFEFLKSPKWWITLLTIFCTLLAPAAWLGKAIRSLRKWLKRADDDLAKMEKKIPK